jgi:ligand-binding sensor domain-containing protein/signal transduction histidine kinase
MKPQYFLRLIPSLLIYLSLAAVVRGEQLPVKSYTIADGLARDFVNRIRLDSHGFIWFCTAEGISRFDGYAFTNYGVNDGLPHRNVNDFLETRDGIYLFATSGGLVQFNPLGPGVNASHFVVINLDQNERSKIVMRVLQDSDGTLWCGTDNGLYHLSRVESGWQSARIDTDFGRGGINALMFDQRGSLWIGTSMSGLYRRLPSGNLEHYTTRNGLSQDGISAFLLDSEGRVWVGTGQGLDVLVSEPRPNEKITERVYGVNDGLRRPYIASLFQSSDGRIWVGTWAGLHLFVEPKTNDGLSFVTYTPANGLRGLIVQTIIEDGDENLWLAAEGGGAMKIPLIGFTSYFESDGLGNGRIIQIFSDDDHNVYVIADSAESQLSVMRFDGRGFKKLTPNLPSHSKFTWGWNQLILQDHEGDWWIPTERGLYRFSENKSFADLARASPKAYRVKDGLASNEIFRLFEDARGDLWFGTLGDGDRALHRWERLTDKIHIYTPLANIPASGPTAFANDSEGNLWIGFYNGGVARFRAGRFLLFTEKDGIPAGFVRQLFFDSRNRLWIATSNSGVGRVDNPLADKPDFKIITTKNGISSDQVTSVTEDSWGRIYLGTGRGIDRLNPESGELKHFTTADGLADNYVNVSFRDSQGALWFGTLRGLSRFIPEADKPPASLPITISGLRIAGVRQTVSELGEIQVTIPDLNYTQNQLQIDFVSLSYAVGNVVRYQFKFDGSHNDWSSPSEQRTITLPNLLPGSYRFLVRAVNSDGLVSSQPASMTFRILPPIWKRGWFITLGALFLSGFLFSLYRYRVARLREINAALLEAKLAEENLRKANEARLVELERVRKRIATDLHDDIGSSLTRISLLSEVAQRREGDGEKAGHGSLSTIAGLSRELVDSMSDIVWAINPERDHLADLTQRMRHFASDVFTARGIEFTFRLPSFEQEFRVGANFRRELFLIFKEAVNNAVRHSECTEAEIEFRLDGGGIFLKLSDNGRGFDVLSKSDGHGLASMRARTEGLGGKLEIVSDQQLGTTLTFIVPLGRQDSERPVTELGTIARGS